MVSHKEEQHCSKKNFKSRKPLLKGANSWSLAKKKSTSDAADSVLEPTRKPIFKINDKGQKVKKFKDGVERAFIDLDYQEDEYVTFYDGFYIKRTDAKIVDDLKDELKLEGLPYREINKKVMKVLRKAKRELFKEKLYEKKYAMMQSGEFQGPTKIRNKKTNPKDAVEKVKVDNSKSEGNSKTRNISETTKAEKLRKPIDTAEDLGLSYDIDVAVSDEENNDFDKETVKVGGVSYKLVEPDLQRVDESDPEDQVDSGCEDDNDDSESESGNENSGIKVEDSEKCNDIEMGEDTESCSKEKNEEDSVSKKEVKIPSIKYAENNMMTCVQGFWIRRSQIGQVDKMKITKTKEIKDARDNGDNQSPLTKEEELQLKVYMMKELNKLGNKLRAFLQKRLKKQAVNPPKPQSVKKEKTEKQKRKMLNYKNGKLGYSMPGFGSGKSGFGSGKSGFGSGKSGFGSGNSGFGSGNGGFGRNNQSSGSFNKTGFERRKFGSGQDKKFGGSNGNSQEELVRFDGYWVKKEAADRLKDLKVALKAEGASAEVIAEKLKVERRRAENDMKHERKTVCFSCRKSGHVIADCPLKSNTRGVGACFTCGSLEHQSGTCPKANDSKDGTQSFKFATCFICREKGHITMNCPKNDKGIYPKGGACTLCDSKFHLIKDCPRNTDKGHERKEFTAGTMRAGQHLEVMDEGGEIKTEEKTTKKSKKINF